MSNFFLQWQNTPSPLNYESGKVTFRSPSEIHVDMSGALDSVLDGLLDRARAEGFSDCEELIAQWLESRADDEGRMLGSGFRRNRSSALREAALAIRLGQHRREVES